MVLRFITGLCIAAPAATIYAYLGEFCTPSRRVQLISYASVMPSVGIIYVACKLIFGIASELTCDDKFKPFQWSAG